MKTTTELYRSPHYHSDRVAVRNHEQGAGPSYQVIVRNYIIAEFYELDWANGFAAVIDSLLPANTGLPLEDLLRSAQSALLSLVGARHMVAGVLRRAAELHEAAAIRADFGTERESLRHSAKMLRAQADALLGNDYVGLPRVPS